VGLSVSDPHNSLLEELSPALAGLSLTVSPDAWGRPGLGANDGGNQGDFRP